MIASAKPADREWRLAQQPGNAESGQSLFLPHGAYNEFAAPLMCQIWPERPFWHQDIDLGGGVNRVVKALHRRIELGEEELQMLWWLTGGYSRSADKNFDEVPDLTRPLVLARELGGITSVSPGPGSIRALLTRAGVGTANVKLADAVNGVMKNGRRPHRSRSWCHPRLPRSISRSSNGPR